MNKLKNPLIFLIVAIIIIVVVVIVFISPITKYLVEKYDEKYTGRQITMDWAYVNPFTGYIHFDNFKFHELKSDSVFFSAQGISINITMIKILSKVYEISDFTLNHPRGIVIQNKKDFNFSDLIEKFTSKDTSTNTKAPVHFNILKVKIIDGEFHYRENLIPINYFIKKVNIESTGKHWDADTIATKFSFSSGIGNGDMKGDFTFNLKNKDYRLAIVIHKFDLNIIGQYLKDLTNYGSFSANLDADMKAKGKLDDAENVTASGLLAINDFHFGKNPMEDYASFDKLVFAISELSPKNHKYFGDSVSLIHPYFKYERYDYLDNLQTVFGQNGANINATNSNPAKFNLIIEIANYVKELAKNFFQSDYKINRLAIYRGDLKFNDYALSEKFSIGLNPLYFMADSIDKKYKRINVTFRSGIKPYGNLSVALSINPRDSSDFDMNYHFGKIPASLFNPYIISQTSFPLDRGTLELNGKWKVRNGSIQSDNHLLIIDPRVTKRLKNKSTKWIPMWLVMAFVRERGNVIDYEIPITGNLKDPKFHLRDAIFDVFKNIFVKPVTIPYRIQVKETETEIEKSLTLKWEMRQGSLRPKQEGFVERIADFLKKTPDAFIVINPQLFALKEKEYILFYEAKKKYFLETNKKNYKSYSEDDSIMVDKMSIKDPLIAHYLDKKINDSMIFTIQEKCSKLISPDIINSKFESLNREREKAFVSYFKNRGVEKQVKIATAKNVIPYNGFSFYKIEYKGEFPESLIKAYRQMNELNDKAPRKKFKEERKKNKNRL